MRLHLTIQRHGLPLSRILWTTSPPSLFGHNLPSPSSILPATSSAVTSSRMPNALYANGGYTVAQLLEDVNEVIPLETEPQLFEDESSGQWGLEDYVVEVGGSECLHFMEVDGLLRDGDEVLIRALQISDLRARKASGRHQISADGKHLIDGIPFGKPFLKRPTSSRPAITIPPRKKRRTVLATWGSGSNYEEEDTEWAPQHIGTGKELSLLNPESQLENEDDNDYEDAYQDDYEDYHEPNEDVDGTVIRHKVDKTREATESVNGASGSEIGELSQELQDLTKDMEPELEKASAKAPPRGHSLRSRPSILQPAPRKSSLSRRSTGGPSGGDPSRRESKSVTFHKQKQELPAAKPEISVPRAGSTSEEPEDSVSRESTSDSSVSDSSVSESSDEDSASDESESDSAAASEPSSDSGDDSSPESSASESESEQEEVPKTNTALKPSHQANPPGTGSERTRKSNQRCKMRRRLSKLKQLGFLEDNANFDALRDWDSKNGGSNIPNGGISLRKKEQEDFEAKREKLLRDLESGGVDVSPFSEKENVSPNSVGPDTLELPEDQDEHYVTANDTSQASPEVPKRRSLDVASTRRLLFGSLGVRTPRSKEEEEATRKKLAGKVRESTSQQPEEVPAESQRSEPEVDWREKLILGATECVYDDIELSTPPFPFEQRWDAEAGYIIRQRKGRNKKRKRRQQLQVYDKEDDTNGDYYVDDDLQLDYDDAEQPEPETDNKDESDKTATEVAAYAEDDLPDLPGDASSLPALAGDDLKPGLVFAFKQLDVSKATNWQPTVSDYRVAVVSDVFDSNILNIQLAKPYRRQARDVDADEGPFQYSGFEMPGMDEEGEDDGFREVPFDDLIEPKLLRATPAADAGDKDTASIFPADDEQSAQERGQLAIDVLGAGDEHEDDELAVKSNQQPASPNDKHASTSDPSPHEDSPIRSPRFEGFELSHSASSSVSSAPFSVASLDDAPGEEREGASLKEVDETQSPAPSTCPPNADDHDFQETGLTDQLQTTSSPTSVGSYHKLMNLFLSQNSSSSVSPAKSERKSSPVEPALESRSPTVPNPFYEIDKAYEERRQRTRITTQRYQSYDNASSREPSPKAAKTDAPPKRTLRTLKLPELTQETSQVSMILDSVRPEARDLSPPASQMPEFIVDLTQSSPPVSPGGSDEDFTKTHRLPRGSGWVQKNSPTTRRQTRQSSSSSRVIRTLEDASISQPRRRRGRKT